MENNKFGREKRDLPMAYQREIDKIGIGNTKSNFIGSFKNRRKTSSDSFKTPSKPTTTRRSPPMIDRVQSSTMVAGPYNIFDDGLNSAASTLASIVSRQAFDIPQAARDSGGGGGASGGDDIGSVGDRRSAGGRFSLPDIVGPGDDIGSDVRARRDSVGSGVRTLGDTQPRSRDPFGSPVTPQTYNRFRYHAGNTQAAAAATVKTATASG